MHAGLLLLTALALTLVWTSAAPAITRSTLDAQARPTFCAGEHSLALKSDGSLWAWGINTYGAIGDGTTSGRLVPTPIGTDTDWALVAEGAYCSFALKSDGSLWAWGHNASGQLGDGTTTDRLVPTRIGTDVDWVAVAGGLAFSLALKSDGSLWAWGYNEGGRLGDGTTTNRPTPTRIGTDRDWVRISAGSGYCLALKSDGSLWAWGSNLRGQLGDGTTTEAHTPTRVGTDTDWVTVACGPDHSLALKSDGTLWAWGNNVKGELGDDTTIERRVPTRIGTGTTWISVAAGGFGGDNGGVSLGLRSDGSLAAWGYGRHGELGDDGRADRLTPVVVFPSTKFPGAGGISLSDISSSPYKAAIDRLAAAGIIAGFADGTFRPSDPVTRQQFAKMIVLTGGYPVSEADVCPFTDVAKSGPTTLYPDNYIAVCAAKGITTGTSPTTFNPTGKITRYQVVSMVVRMADNLQPGLLATPPATWSGNATWAANPTHGANAARAEYNGLLTGLDLATLAPTGNMSRGEVAQVLHNLLGKLAPAMTTSTT